MKRIKKIILAIFVLTTLFVNGIYTIAYIFDITNPITNIFKPYSFTERTLRITKKLIHPYKDTYQIPSNIEFTYQINLGSFYQNKLITTSLGNYQTNEMGIINLTIKAANLTNGCFYCARKKQIATLQPWHKFVPCTPGCLRFCSGFSQTTFH